MIKWKREKEKSELVIKSFLFEFENRNILSVQFMNKKIKEKKRKEREKIGFGLK